MKTNSHDPPRTPQVMAMIKDYDKRREREIELKGTIDRGLDTEAQFGTFREFQRTIEFLLKANTFIAHRTRMDLLISQFMLLRSEDRRYADLCDLVAVESLNEAGFQKNVQMLILRLRQGKVLILYFDILIIRPIRREMHNMPVPFGIKRSNYVLSAPSLYIYSYALILKWNHGHPFMIALNGIRQSSLRFWVILIRPYLTHIIENFAMMPSKRPNVVI